MAATWIAKAEEKGIRSPPSAESLESLCDKAVSWALPETTGLAAQYQHPLAAFVIVLDVLIHPGALGLVQLMTPFV